MAIQIRPVPCPSARWYAVRCQSRRERVAADHLRKQNFPVFLPCRLNTRRHARKIDNVLAPFFPGYLFVKLDLSRDRWRSVNGTRGVFHLVMQGDAPVAVPAGIVESIQEHCGKGDVLESFPDLQPGQMVRVVVGAFTDFVGELDRYESVRRIRVFLELMGGRIPVNLSSADVVAAGA